MHIRYAVLIAALLLVAASAGCTAEDNLAAAKVEVLELPAEAPSYVAAPAKEIITAPAYTVEPMDAAAGYVAAGGVNLRTGPGTAYAVQAVLERHAQVSITGKSGGWYRVRYGATMGYVSGEFIGEGPIPTPTPTPAPTPTPKPYTVKKLSTKQAYVNAAEVNFRKGPDTSYPILAQADRYDRVTVTGESGEWYRIRYNSNTGYMLKRYIEVGVSPKQYEGVGKYSQAEVLLLAQIAYRESARGSYEGYQAVASVVINRVHSKKYPNTIEKVVFQGKGGQFSPAGNEERLRLTVPSKQCVKAVREVLKSGSILPKDVLYFRTASKGKSWASSRKYYDTYGGNCYFW